MSKHQQDAPSHDAAMASVHLSKRREVRYAISFPIEVTGVSRDGRPFHEKTCTLNVSEWGCGFASSRELHADDMILIRRIVPRGQAASQPARQAFFQVVRVERSERGWTIGAWKMDSADVWGEELVKLGKPSGGSLESRREGGQSEADETEKDRDS